MRVFVDEVTIYKSLNNRILRQRVVFQIASFPDKLIVRNIVSLGEQVNFVNIYRKYAMKN